MEHKGGRIKDHISREKHPGQDDWMDVEWLDDDWTVVTEDGSLAAHYENTILITEGEPEILTLSHTEEDL